MKKRKNKKQETNILLTVLVSIFIGLILLLLVASTTTKDEVYNKVEIDDKFQEIEERHMYRIEIHSSNGVIFKNGIINTILSVKLYNWDKEITEEVDPTRFIWTRISNDQQGDLVWNNQHAIGSKSVSITASDVKARATFNVDFVDENGQSLLA